MFSIILLSNIARSHFTAACMIHDCEYSPVIMAEYDHFYFVVVATVITTQANRLCQGQDRLLTCAAKVSHMA